MATAYVPLSANEGPALALYASTSAASPLAVLAPEIRSAVHRADPELPVEDLMTMAQAMERWSQPARFVALLMGSLSIVAIVLASIGVYGVMAYTVAQRWREIGIRIALGASSAQVRRLLVGSALRMVSAGLALGLLGAWVGTRALEGILAGTSPTDPFVFSLAENLLGTAGRCAASNPARRARPVDPVLALRAKVEQATLAAVRAYEPAPFAGHLQLLVPSRTWAQRSRSQIYRWTSLAATAESAFGPEGCNADNMLLGPHAAIFAAHLRQAFAQGALHDRA
jgi:predicted lysophospholipase L1 biosynthesis ABC-type transport system permease subunit